MARTKEEAHKRILEKNRARRAANPEKFCREAREWRAANPDRVRAHNKKCYLKNRERRLQNEKEARLANPELFRKRSKANRIANLKNVHAQEAAWRERNRARIRIAAMARHLRKRNEILDYLKKMQRGKCAYCRENITGTPHIDHIMPKALGGSNELSNLQLTCATCNFSKNAKHPIEFARYMGRLI
jgi:5-methylcytosine-specific restriction endonuclease McrA